MMKVAIIDCGISNLTSVKNAFERLGASVDILTTDTEISKYSHFVLPGVGAFHCGMENLKSKGLDVVIHAVVERGLPLMGICLGMQLLGLSSEEFGFTPGLELIPGHIRQVPTSPDLRLPHVGWNDVRFVGESPLWKGIKENTAFYFVHSYAYQYIEGAPFIIGVCDYGTPVVASVTQERVYGVQFHPEKSQKAGLKLLTNFLQLC